MYKKILKIFIIMDNNGVLLPEEIEEIKDAFAALDGEKKGKLDIKFFKKAMLSLGFDLKEPFIAEFINELDTPEIEKNGGILIDDFINALNKKIGNTNSEEGVKKIFEMLKDEPTDQTITLDSLKKNARQFGIKVSTEELKNMLNRVSANGEELTFEEFNKVITKE